MNYVHCFDKKLKEILVSQGYLLIQEYKCNNLNVWVFDTNKEILNYLKYSADNNHFFISSKLMF